MQYPTVVNGFDFRDLVFLSGAESSTDTLKVAKAFGKEHKDLLRKTRQVSRLALMISQSAILRFVMKKMSYRTENLNRFIK